MTVPVQPGPVRLVSVVIGGVAERWSALGFTVSEGGLVAFANGAIEIEVGAVGAVALRVDGIADLAPTFDGVPLRSGRPVTAEEHPNGCFELDHVVVMTPSLERTSAAVAEVLGLPRRRLRETDTVRQAFHRFDEHGCIVEIVESDRLARASAWGVVVNTADLDGAIERAGPDLVGAPKPAVQPGRRIATVRAAAGLGIPVALMTP